MWNKKEKIKGIPTLIPTNLPENILKALILRIRFEEIQYRLKTKQFDAEKVLESFGYSENEVSKENKQEKATQLLFKEREEIIEKINEMKPEFTLPKEMELSKPKIRAKVYIPQLERPDINFMGLLIGPRGKTIKELQLSTNTKISIKGRGSDKHNQGIINPFSDEEEMHALIIGDDEESVEKAKESIQKIISSEEDSINQIKTKQLRELAKIQGTLIENHPFNNSLQNQNTQKEVNQDENVPQEFSNEYDSYLKEIQSGFGLNQNQNQNQNQN
ncbi:splicing factor 1 [Anaeramoeba ignava]|uniref:Branchpoint-bridging protein n=1 Tax=Anaeramoeba ignava TaxID=1746090 RepID=A0A9Q0R558_ANAIG|nr:splicing factor 1 [Anaeramoeba ignava]